MAKLFRKKPKILFVASEAAPFVKVGGLGEVMRSLPRALRELGYDARVMVPKYDIIDTKKFPLQLELEGLHPSRNDEDPHKILVSNILRYDENKKTIAYFVENMEYYEKRANVYGYSDDTLRWVLFSRCVLEFLRESKWVPDIIVASDWQTGFVPNLLKTEYQDSTVLSKVKTIFSIHNLQFQGMFDHHFVSEMDFDAGQAAIPNLFDPKLLKLNGMRRGIMYADLINAVSPTYAKEILTEQFGETLEELLSERRSCLLGILNGIDIEEMNPETDSNIETNYSVSDLEKRVENKPVLQKQFGLPIDPEKFVIGIVSRMEDQKGFSLIVEIADSLMQNVDFQLVVVGSGSNEYRTFFQGLQEKYPERVAGHYFFDAKLPRLIFSGADAVLIPSRFEPSGLVQMEAMRYGAVPIVRKTGGLADSVEDYDSETNVGTGFVFEPFDKFALLIAIVRAAGTFHNKKEWEKIVKRAIRKDFSWKKSAQEYIKLFASALADGEKKEE